MNCFSCSLDVPFLPGVMLTKGLFPLQLKILDILDFTNIFSDQIQIATFPVKSQESKQIINISIALFHDKILSLFPFQLYNLDTLFFLDISNNKELVIFELDTNQEHEPVDFPDSSQLS
jgi:hypothetical protein